MGYGSPRQADSHRESSDCGHNHVACYSGICDKDLKPDRSATDGHRYPAYSLTLTGFQSRECQAVGILFCRQRTSYPHRKNQHGHRVSQAAQAYSSWQKTKT